MDYIKELMNVGDDVLRTVTYAIENNDFSHLSDDLKARFSDFAAEVKEDAGNNRVYDTKARRSTYDKTMYWYDPATGESGVSDRKDTAKKTSGTGPWNANRTYRPSGRTGYGASDAQEYAYARRRRKLTPFRPRFFGKGSAVAKMVTGIIGMISFIPANFATMLMMLAGDHASMIGFFSLLPFSAASLWLTFSGNKKRKLIDNYNRYAEIVGPVEYISMEELATNAGTSEEDAVKDIEQLMKNNMLPQGRFDLQKTTLMLTPRMWKQYQAAEQARHQRELEETLNPEPQSNSMEENPENSILQEGNEFVKKIHHFNDQIPDPDMSEKLSRLESIMQRIFQQVEKEPDSASNLHKLMNYYLPTIEKLLTAYVDLENHPSDSENIERTRKEIEEAVDTVNVAFENLFDDLFQDTAWDISSDISVMKTMMKQDGLMEKTKV